MNGSRWINITKGTTLHTYQDPFGTLSSSKIIEEGILLSAIFSNNVFAGADIVRMTPPLVVERSTAF